MRARQMVARHPNGAEVVVEVLCETATHIIVKWTLGQERRFSLPELHGVGQVAGWKLQEIAYAGSVTASQKLSRWLAREGLGCEHIADTLGVELQLVSRWLVDDAYPTRKQAAQISKATDGAVKVADWGGE